MKKIFLFLCIVFFAAASMCARQDIGIGEEFVTPLNYPKFSLMGDYSVARWFKGFADSSLHQKVDNRFSAALSFEAGLLRHLNAGALFSFSFSQVKQKSEPIDLKLGLFAKPFFPLTERLSIFMRASGGLVTTLLGNSLNFVLGEPTYKGQQYQGTPFGAFASATIGFDYFPFSRIGLSVEWGIRADFLHKSRKNPDYSRAPDSVPGAPSSFNYLMYEIPASLTLHFIL